jgi:hypothetical protein
VKKRRLSICHVIFRLDIGGLENGLVNQVNRLDGEEFSHSIMCLTHATAFRQRIEAPHVSVLELHKEQGLDLQVYRRAWKLLQRMKPDIVHTYNYAALDVLAAARVAGVRRFVHSEHGLDMSELDGLNRRRNRLRMLSRVLVDRYVAVSTQSRYRSSIEEDCCNPVWCGHGTVLPWP